MKLQIVAVGLKLPDWAQTACDEYLKRFAPDFRVEVKTVRAEVRTGKPVSVLLQAERERLESAVHKGCRVLALDERGSNLSTQGLADRLLAWQQEGTDVAWLIGGADGLDPGLKQAAHERIRLSDLTLPHALVRVLLLEQLYRAWSINAHHPYHRA
ncbi:MAG: 23S rRNA (pseudouridine(1915)-N(3))-methyltransferase RlmH [Betaproteobacteria bacterium]